MTRAAILALLALSGCATAAEFRDLARQIATAPTTNDTIQP